MRTIRRMRTFRRAHLGRNFSDGARQLWGRLKEKSLTIEDLAKIGRWSRGAAHHWLYGDRRPSLATAVVLQKELGIPVCAWSTAPRRPFSLDRAERGMRLT